MIAANNTFAETETACRYGLLTVYRMLPFQSKIKCLSPAGTETERDVRQAYCHHVDPVMTSITSSNGKC